MKLNLGAEKLQHSQEHVPYAAEGVEIIQNIFLEYVFMWNVLLDAWGTLFLTFEPPISCVCVCVSRRSLLCSRTTSPKWWKMPKPWRQHSSAKDTPWFQVTNHVFYLIHVKLKVFIFSTLRVPTACWMFQGALTTTWSSWTCGPWASTGPGPRGCWSSHQSLPIRTPAPGTRALSLLVASGWVRNICNPKQTRTQKVV